MPEISRREFLKLAGNSGAILASGIPTKVFDRLIPYVIPPEEIRPGVWVQFATTCRECPAGCGMHMWHRDGRVTKAEGNPGHPINYGGLCPRGQSCVQGLYDPDRIQYPLHRKDGSKPKQVSWSEAIEQISKQLGNAGGKVALISDLQTGTLAELMQAFMAAFGSQSFSFYEPFNYESLRNAHEAVFGLPTIPDYRLDRCEFIISFAADFLESWISPVSFAHRFSSMHSYHDGKIGRFAYVGPRLSMTAANADDFLRVQPGLEFWVALAMLDTIVKQGWAVENVEPIKPLLDSARIKENLPATVPADVIEGWARSFIEAKMSVALPGPVGSWSPLSQQTAIAAALLNYAAGRVGKTVDFSRPHALSNIATHAQAQALLSELTDAHVLIIHSTNPAYSLYPSAEKLRKAGTVVYLGTLMDETAQTADWVLPIDSPLESWGDYEPAKGTHSLLQPTMGRLFDTRLAGDVFLDLANATGRSLQHNSTGGALPGFEGVLHQRWEQLRLRLAPSRSEQDFWNEALRSGGVWEEPPAVKVELRPDIKSLTFPNSPAAIPEKIPTDYTELWVWPSIMLFDGRVANRNWLQEAPEPVAYISWGNWIYITPKQARALGVRTGDVVELRTPAGKIEAPARVTEDVVEHVAAISFGQGHTALGRNALGLGANPFQLLSATSPQHVFSDASIRKTGACAKLAYGAKTEEQYHRNILQWVYLSDLRKMHPGEGDHLILPLPEGYDVKKDVYPPREYKNHRWAMVIDLNRCIGCGACAVACYAENNIAMMGSEQDRKGREMAWMKIAPYRDQENPGRVGFLPMLCQHCDCAPCEPVCPVFAAVHNEEGLNAQVYNRCIGTRYCSNNCPYKARRFNWLNHEWVEPLDLQLNPEVTVRCRGVMEKCTFCIQRIRQVEHRARREDRPVRDGEIQPACAQSCPTQAIVFGDLIVPESRVTQMTRLDPRRYHVLEELNTKPAVTYLRRIKVDHKP